MMNFGFLAEYVKKDDQILLPEEPRVYTEYFLQWGNVFIIDIHKQQEHSIIAYDVKKREERKLLQGEVTKLFVPLMAKPNPKGNTDNCFSNQSEEYMKFLNILSEEFTIVNDIDAILKNTSKQYLLDLQDRIPSIETKKIETLEQLTELNSEDTVYIVKPLVDERSQDTMVLDNVPKSTLLKLYEKHVVNAYLGQGLIYQKFSDAFLEGEIKSAVVNGVITSTKIDIPNSQEKAIHRKVGNKNITSKEYQLSEDQKEFVLDTYNKYCSYVSPVHYARIDFIMEGGQPKMSEIEVINPNFNMSSNIYTKETIAQHYEAIYKLLQ